MMPHVETLPDTLERIHIMGIGGTAMGALAGMLVDEGYGVTGSDTGVYPPMSDYLAGLGIDVMVGYNAENLAHNPDLVVVGNVIRKTYGEAEALLESDIPYTSFPSFLGAKYLASTRNLVVAGTHGKTTTTSLIAWLLDSAGKSPGFLIGGLAANFDRTARRGGGGHFVVEGDEYDTAFFDKRPKFVHYRPTTAILTSIEFDHADIYDDLDQIKQSFSTLVDLVPKDGLLVARGDDPLVDEVSRACDGAVRLYGKDQQWDGQIEGIDTSKGTMRFSVLRAGQRHGTFESTMVGEHNLYNQVAAIAALEAEGLSVEELARGLASFRGIKRRQEVIAEVGGITLIDDFAHHPTAVSLTLQALRMRFGTRRIWAIFEPRSNTSRRNVFQQAYANSFDAADVVVVAPPVGLERIATEERFDVDRLLVDLRGRGAEAYSWGAQAGREPDPDSIADATTRAVTANALPEDVIAILSNGGFGGLHKKLVAALRERFSDDRTQLSLDGLAEAVKN